MAPEDQPRIQIPRETRDFNYGSHPFETISYFGRSTTIFECYQNNDEVLVNSINPTHSITLGGFEEFWRNTIVPVIPSKIEQLATEEKIPLILHPFSDLPASRKELAKAHFEDNPNPAIPLNARVGDISITITHIASAHEILTHQELVGIGDSLREWAQKSPDMLVENPLQLQKEIDYALRFFKYFVLSPEERKYNKGFQHWDKVIYQQFERWRREGFELPPQAQHATQALTSFFPIAQQAGIEIPLQNRLNVRKPEIISETAISEIGFRDFTNDQIETICNNLLKEKEFDEIIVQRLSGLFNLACCDFDRIFENIKQNNPQLLLVNAAIQKIFTSFSPEAIQNGSLPQFDILQHKVSFTQKKGARPIDKHYDWIYLLVDNYILPIDASVKTSENELYRILENASRFRWWHTKATNLLTPIPAGAADGNR